MTGKVRCFGDGDPLMEKYHDEEWGVPVHDDRMLFEKLLLDGFQAGLSWRTVLHKRENLRKAFDGFQPEQIARYGDADRERLLADAGIIRNKLKVAAAISNAQAYLEMVSAGQSFSEFLWSFTGHEVIQHAPHSWEEVPASSDESQTMSTALLVRGFKFVGPTICYAFMQAVGMIDDHLVGCHKFKS